jgi:SagB-type dehydrogenase family enzyme
VPSFTARYHELTKYRPETIDRLGGVRWDEQPEPFKDIPEGRHIDLVPHLKALFAAEGAGEEDAPDATRAPRSVASGLEAGILPVLARLAHGTLGLTARLSGGGGHDVFLRASPSAGGLYPTELYFAARAHADLPAGVYHYHARRSALVPVWEGDFSADLRHHFLNHPAVAAALDADIPDGRAGCIALFTGIYARSAWRYKERAYRRILLDTGHAAANLLELAVASGLDAVPLGAFVDAGLEELLFLGRKEEFPLLGVAIASRGALPPADGQRPGPSPEIAVTRADIEDAMMVQQNACERIEPGDALRDPVPSPQGPERGLVALNPLPVILRRRSTRRFTAGDAVSLDAMLDLLRFAYGTAGAPEASGPSDALGRNEPLLDREALGHHVVVFAVEGLEPGVYALEPETLTLTPVREGDFRADLHAVSLGQDLASDCAFALVHTADMESLVETYGDRGYRYACMECGMIGERLQLRAVQRGLGSSGIGGYYDDLANELLGLPLSHGILYITVAGVPADG